MSILVIDDERIVRDLMREILVRAGYETVGAESAERALELLDDDRIRLVVSDVVMPGLSGIQLIEEVRKRRPSVPVVLVTGAGTYENLSDAVSHGADGFVMKPFSHADLERAVEEALRRAERSEEDVRARLLAPALAAALGNAIEARESGLHGHCERLAALAVRIAERVGMPIRAVETIKLGAVLHDVGKIGIPDRVLLKASPLSDEERALMRTHTLIGDRLLEPLDILAEARAVVRHHHERWDGNGYPDRLEGEEIPLEARIVAVADAVEAMSGPRVYRPALAPEAVVHELQRGRGTQWDPALVDVVLELIRAGELVFGTEGLALAPDEPPAPPEPRFTVLLVEDDPDDAALAAQALEAAIPDVRIVRAGTVEEAIELCGGVHWSLALVDHRLPDGSGLELISLVKERAPTVPVLLLTDEGSEAIAVEAFRCGASDYVVKANGFVGDLTLRVQMFVVGP